MISFGRSRERLGRAMELGAIDRASESLEWALEGPRPASPAGRWARCPSRWPPRWWRPPRTAWSATSARPTGPGSWRRSTTSASCRRPSRGGVRDGRGGARARRPVPGRRLVPDAARRSSGLLYERLRKLIVSFGARRSPSAPVPRPTPSPPGQPPAARAGERAVSQAPRARPRRRAAPARRAELPRRHPRGRRGSAIWTDIYLANREAIAAEIDETISRLREVASALAPGTPPRSAPGTRARRGRPAPAARGRSCGRAESTSCG